MTFEHPTPHYRARTASGLICGAPASRSSHARGRVGIDRVTRGAGRVLWLCLLAGCSLQAAPESSNAAQRSTLDAGEWMPNQRPTEAASKDAAMASQLDAAAPPTSTAQADPAADGGKAQPAKGGAASTSQGGKAASTSANGSNSGAGGMSGETARQDPDGNGGAGTGGVSTSSASNSGAGAAAPAQPSAGNPATPQMGGNAGARAGAPAPRNMREALVDAVIGVLMQGNNGNGNGNGNNGDWNNWRRAAGDSGDLSPEFVTPMLNALLLSRTCVERVETCISVCVVMSQNCQPCVAEKECRAALSRVCGERVASCP